MDNSPIDPTKSNPTDYDVRVGNPPPPDEEERNEFRKQLEKALDFVATVDLDNAMTTEAQEDVVEGHLFNLRTAIQVISPPGSAVGVVVVLVTHAPDDANVRISLSSAGMPKETLITALTNALASATRLPDRPRDYNLESDKPST